MTALLLAVLLALLPSSAPAESLRVRLEVGADAAEAVPEVGALERSVQSQFERAFGRYAQVSFDSTRSEASNARVTIGRQGASLSVSTELSREGITRSISSTVPAGAAGSLAAVLQGDLAFLFFSAQGFAPLALSAAPGLSATLQTDTLEQLTAWDPSELEPLDLAPSGDGVVVCFPHRYLTLGRLFDVTAETVRDIHAQSAGREPLQLSGVATDGGQWLYLLSEAAHKVARVNPRLGSRQVFDAPELSARGARTAGGGTLAILSEAGSPSVSMRAPTRDAQWSLSLGASYASAFATDSEGNLWLWDAAERRVRILASDGLETYSIKPLFKASFMPLPQQLQVFDDGSFLLGGSGEVWKFASTGVPLWRLTRMPGRPGEKLPSSFVLAANRSDGSFVLLDAPSRRLLSFAAPAVSTAEADLASLLSRMDNRKPEDMARAAGLASSAGLSLVAWQFADLLAGRTGEQGARAEARIELLRQKAGLYVQLADSYMRDLLYDRADAAYLRAGEWLRELGAESPGDAEGARLLEVVVSRRQEIRDALATVSDVTVVPAEAVVGGECAEALSVKLHLRNVGAESLSTVRVHLSIPGLAAAPSLVAVDSLAPGEERDVQARWDLADGDLPWSTATVEALVTYVRGVDGFSAPLSFTAKVEPPAELSAAEALACGADPADQLVASLPDELLPAGSKPDRLTAFAAVMDSLGRLRSLASAQGAMQAANVPSGDEPPHVRQTLRGLSADERDWAVLAVSVASSLGLRAGLLEWQGRSFALVETDLPLIDALSAIPGLGRYDRLLAGLSRGGADGQAGAQSAEYGGALCVPLSARPAPVGRPAVAWSVVDALAALENADGAVTAWAQATPSRQFSPAPMAFPYPIPTAREITRETLRAETEEQIAIVATPG
jgi:hypothetical protein